MTTYPWEIAPPAPGADLTPPVYLIGASGSDDALGVGVDGDDEPRLAISLDGEMQWGYGGPGSEIAVLSLTPDKVLNLRMPEGFSDFIVGDGTYAGPLTDVYASDGLSGIDFAVAGGAYKGTIKARAGGMNIGELGNAIAFYEAAPVVRAAAIASPTAPGIIYSQAEAASMKTAVDAIRVALQNIGVTL